MTRLLCALFATPILSIALIGAVEIYNAHFDGEAGS